MKYSFPDTVIRVISLAAIIVSSLSSFIVWRSMNIQDSSEYIYTHENIQNILVVSSSIKPVSWKFIILHHSKTPQRVSFNQFQDWCKKKGFDDIPYHFVITPSGIIKPTLYWKHQKALIRQAGDSDVYDKNTTIGICLMGDFSSPESPVPDIQMKNMVMLVSSLQDTYGIKPYHMYPRSEIDGVKSPGPGFKMRKFLKLLRSLSS